MISKVDLRSIYVKLCSQQTTNTHFFLTDCPFHHLGAMCTWTDRRSSMMERCPACQVLHTAAQALEQLHQEEASHQSAEPRSPTGSAAVGVLSE